MALVATADRRAKQRDHSHHRTGSRIGCASCADVIAAEREAVELGAASMSRACRVELPGLVGSRWKTTRTDCNTRNMKTARKMSGLFQFVFDFQ
jgi:hypothetical protein